MIDRKLVEILRCPVTGQAVTVAPKARLRELNAAIDAGELCHPGGRKVAAPLETALLTSDGKRIYPVRDGIPIMLADEAIVAADETTEEA